MDSRVPIAAGLSSSSAFTVCASLVTMHANGIMDKVPKGDLSKICTTGERLAGTACGGMDQTISIFAEMNKAKLIEFNPVLQTSDAHLPQNMAIVISNSLIHSPKVLTVGTRFNKRVVECRLALYLLTFKVGLVDSWESVTF